MRFNRYFICGIDGTVDHFLGIKNNMEANQRDYDAKFARSFVRQLCNVGDSSRYFRGPATTGSGLGYAMENAVTAIAQRYRNDCAQHLRTRKDCYDPDNCAYVLTGDSRGAAGIIEVATRLQGSPVTKGAVHVAGAVTLSPAAMLVPNYANPRSIITGSRMIPSDVENCVHYIRGDDTDSRSGTMAKYKGGPSDPGKTSYKAMSFKATHGGLGGLPYFTGTGEGNNIPILKPGSAFATNVTMAEDMKASRDVAKHATTFCSRLGSPCSLGV